MTKRILIMLFLVALSMLALGAGIRNNDTSGLLQALSKPPATATPQPNASDAQQQDTPANDSSPTFDWSLGITPAPPGDPRAPREGWPGHGYPGPIVATPAGTLSFWAWATPCNGWIDANGTMYCVTATAIPPTATPLPGYPGP